MGIGSLKRFRAVAGWSFTIPASAAISVKPAGWQNGAGDNSFEDRPILDSNSSPVGVSLKRFKA